MTIKLILSQKQLHSIALGGTAVGTGANTPKGYRKSVIVELGKISKLQLQPQKDMQYALQSKFPIFVTIDIRHIVIMMIFL